MFLKIRKEPSELCKPTDEEVNLESNFLKSSDGGSASGIHKLFKVRNLRSLEKYYHRQTNLFDPLKFLLSTIRLVLNQLFFTANTNKH